jgi:hypothetical protein
MTTSELIRGRILVALEADLIGPFHLPEPGRSDAASPAPDEVLSLPPSRWYLTGFLAPLGDRETNDATADDALGAGPDEDDEDADHQEPEPKQRKRFPASLGLSVLVPPASKTPESVRVTLRFAEYVAEGREVEGARRPKTVWRRVPRGPFTVEAPLDPKSIEQGKPVEGAKDVRISGKLETAEAPGLPPGTRALAVFVVNGRPEGERGRQDEQFLFQVALELEYERGLVPRPNRQGEQATDWDDRVADLQFRGRFEWAVGHGVSATVPDAQGAQVTRVCTSWLPRYEVRRVKTREEPGVETSMEKLGLLEDGEALRAALMPLALGYGAWLETQRNVQVDSPERKERIVDPNG